MDIDITAFVANADPQEFSASRAEMGDNTGPETWRNAVSEGQDRPLLTAPDELDAMRLWAQDFGAWDAEEIAAWSAEECNAILIQYISGDIREAEGLCPTDDGGIDWNEYDRLADAGTVGGCLYRGDDGRAYFYMGT